MSRILSSFLMIFMVASEASAFWFYGHGTTARFFLFTKENPVVGQCLSCNIQTSNFDATRPTKFIIHGFGENATSNINRDIKNAFLAQGDFNIIVVDWSQSAGCIYSLAAHNIHSVGYAIGQFMDRLNANNQDIHIVGFDYGAHMASVASKTSMRGRVGRITGLDPAAKGVQVVNPAARLNTGDATYVEVFHSNSGYLGIGIPIGNTDFYINDGINQPGCPTKACSHYQAVVVFRKLLANPVIYEIQPCQIVNQLTFQCSGDAIDYSDRTPDGVYTINTKSQSELVYTAVEPFT